MPLVRTPAVVLHSFAYGDTSRILRLLTPEYGVRSVIAKGARSPKSRFGGILEPFTEGEAQFNLREGRDLLTLSGFTLIRSRQGIGRDLASFTGASVIAELFLRFGTEEGQAALYDVLVSALDRLAADAPDPAGTALATLWHLIALFGFHPELRSCVNCGKPIEPAEPSRFDIAAGGVACMSCRRVGRTVSAGVRDEIGRMCAGGSPPQSTRDRRTHADLLSAYLSACFEGMPLRSLPMFLESLR